MKARESKMKKLLGLTALAAVFVLAACGGGSSDEIVCTIEEEIMGVQMSMTITAQSEDGYITTGVVEGRINVSDLDSDQAELFANMFEGEVEGDYFVFSETEDATGEEMTVDEFIEEAEAEGATCN